MIKNNLKISPLIKQFKSLAPRGNALDIGAGRGDNALYLAECGFNVTALEIKKMFINEIADRVKNSENKLEVVCIDYKKYEIKKDRSAFISAFNSLNYSSKADFYKIINDIIKVWFPEVYA